MAVEYGMTANSQNFEFCDEKLVGWQIAIGWKLAKMILGSSEGTWFDVSLQDPCAAQSL
jgi:hypothetical protein